MSAPTAFVLAAGFGTRLRPLTLERPKPLVPVCGVPMLAYSLALCRRHGFTDVIVNAHWLAGQVEAWRGQREGVAVTVVVESPDILGTGGGLKRVRAQMAERFVVVNADVLCDVDLGRLLGAVPPNGAAMSVRPFDGEDRYGVVAVDGAGAVVQLRAVSAPAVGGARRDTHSTGVHALDRSVLDGLPDGFACIVGDRYLDLVPERRVRGVRHEGVWLDVGDPAAYLAANLAVLAGEVTLALDPMSRASFACRGDAEVGHRPDADLVGDVWVGAGAVVHGARLTRSVVGDASTVASGASLEDCVVWDGVAVPKGTHRRTVFTQQGAFLVA